MTNVNLDAICSGTYLTCYPDPSHSLESFNYEIVALVLIFLSNPFLFWNLGSKKCHRNKKKVRFAQSASQRSGICEKETCKTNMAKPCLNRGSKGLESPMPLNRLALYRGIIEYRMHFPKKEYGVSGGRNVSHVRYGSH